jgi:hypothetical protein
MTVAKFTERSRAAGAERIGLTVFTVRKIGKTVRYHVARWIDSIPLSSMLEQTKPHYPETAIGQATITAISIRRPYSAANASPT